MSEGKSIITPDGIKIKEGDRIKLSSVDWSEEVTIVYKYETLGFIDKSDNLVIPIHWHFRTSKIEKL